MGSVDTTRIVCDEPSKEIGRGSALYDLLDKKVLYQCFRNYDAFVHRINVGE